jgi:uncharacterized protein (DUF2236 family)
MSRFATRDEIEKLDAQADHQRIVYLASQYDFGFSNQRALEFALFKTYAAPRMTAILDSSRQFYDHGQRRYDDTALIIAEIVENGYDSERGRAAIRRMNNIHRHFPIDNEDYLYTLSVFIYEPIRWNRLLGWRRFTEKERLALFYFWREVGKRMNIKDIPDTTEAFERWSLEYEQRYFTFADTNQKIADATIAVFAGWVPAFMRPVVKPAVIALLDDLTREAFGYPKQPSLLTSVLRAVLRLRAGVIRLLPANRTPYAFTKQKNRTYPHGYDLSSIGTAPGEQR